MIVTADEVGDIASLEVITEHNGGICSRDFVSHMRHSPYELVRFHSQFMTLYPGDLLTTGTPPGVGMGMKPQPVYLKPGDSMHLGIDKLGEQRQRVIAWRHRGALVSPVFVQVAALPSPAYVQDPGRRAAR